MWVLKTTNFESTVECKIFFFKETTRILLDVLQEELGGAFDGETRNAWNNVLAVIHGILAKENEPAALSESDKQIMRDIWTIAKTKHEGISGRMMIK